MYSFHVRDDNRVPFATVTVGGDLFGVAVCGPNDKFNKERGRSISIGRVLVRPGYIPNPNRQVVVGGRKMSVREAVLSRVPAECLGVLA